MTRSFRFAIVPLFLCACFPAEDPGNSDTRNSGGESVTLPVIEEDGGSEIERTDGGLIMDGGGDTIPDQPDAGTVTDAGDMEPSDGFIGSPCNSSDDCAYEDAECVTGDIPGGMCTQACDLYCPDQDGYPVTFCVDSDSSPDEFSSLGDGACFSRCDYGLFPGTGCRDGFGCVSVPRANEPDTFRHTCVPGAEATPLSDCQLELAAMGVSFEPTTIADTSPEGHPELTCHVEDPIILHPPINGVDLIYYDGTPTPNITAACNMAQALVQTVDDVRPLGVTAIRHIGTYNCRVISGTSTLSRHSFADAIDIYGFDFEDGSSYTLIDDWEHDTEDPMSQAAAFLYDAAYRWHDAFIWNIILTPNYNAAHDNHFHVDMTPSSHFVGHSDGRYIGPAPYAD